MSRMAHDLFRLIQNLSCKGACYSKVCNDDAVLGVFAPCLKELPVLHHAGMPSYETCAAAESRPVRVRRLHSARARPKPVKSVKAVLVELLQAADMCSPST